MKQVSFLRHDGWVAPEDLGDTLNVIGVGATGSHIALTAARMGFHKIRIWDADRVEPHNLPNQAYGVQDLGEYKVNALKRVLHSFNPNIDVECNPEFFTAETVKKGVSGPVVLTVDTMKARKEIVGALRLNVDVPLILETRLGFTYAEVHVLDPLNLQDMNNWLEALRTDEEIPAGPCNRVICTTLVTLIAGYATHLLCERYARQRAGEEWKPPSKTMIDLENHLQVFTL